jgi:hypothetical protein
MTSVGGVGDGPNTPQHSISHFLGLHEVTVGLFLIVFALAECIRLSHHPSGGASET